MRMRRRWVFLVCGVAFLVACGSELPSDSGTDPTARSEIPTRLDIVCGADGSTELVNDEVGVQADGIHIQVDNRADEFVSLNGVGLDFPEGTTTQIAQAAPGELAIACWPGSMHEGPEPERVTVHVHDPDNHWTFAELECPGEEGIVSTAGDFAPDSEGISGTPEEIARAEAKGIEDTDAVESVGYPDADRRQVAVQRNGRTVALLSLSLAPNGGWLLGGYSACSSSGISV